MTLQLLGGKVAIVTGAGAGIGKSIATVLAREGAQVVAVDLSGAEQALAAELGAAVAPFSADVGDEEQIEAMFAFAKDRFGRVDILVNNAATLGGRQPEITQEEYDRLTEVNLRGVLLCCKYAIRAMAESGGSIVNIASVAGFNTAPQTSVVYAAAKAGVISLTKSLAVHHAAQGIRVNAIAPGYTRTEKQADLPIAWQEMAASKAPIGRLGRTEEQAEVVAFLASDRASFVTGVCVPVDGGWSAQLP